MTRQIPDTPASNQNNSSCSDLHAMQVNLFDEPLHFLVDADETAVASIINVLADADRPVLLAARNESDRRRMLDKILLLALPEKTCRITASLMMNEWELLVHFANAVNISVEGKDLPGLERDLGNWFSDSHSEVINLLCIVEDAQLLSESLTIYVVQFARSHKLKLVLMAANTETFQQFDEQDLFRWQITAFSPATTRQYLDKRFRLAGYSTPEVFDDRIVAWICNTSQGDQQLIDQAALRVLEHTKLEKAPMTGADYIKWVLLFAVVLLLFPGIYLLNSSTFSRQSIISGGTGNLTLTAAPAKSAPALPFKIVAKENNLKEGHLDTNPATDRSASTAAREQPATRQAVQPESYNSEVLQLPDHLTADWLKRVNPEFYTIQVIGSHSKEKIDRFMKSGKSTEGYAWFESSYDAQPWYVVIKGVYRSRDAALGEAAQVKKETGIEPWIRSFENMSEVR